MIPVLSRLVIKLELLHLVFCVTAEGNTIIPDSLHLALPRVIALFIESVGQSFEIVIQEAVQLQLGWILFVLRRLGPLLLSEQYAFLMMSQLILLVTSPPKRESEERI
jgi:hypothetical protein